MTEPSGYDTKALKSRGFMKQKGADYFSVRLRVVGGRVTADHLEALARLSREYGRAEVHLTTRQGVEIPNVHGARLEAFEADLADAGLALGPAGPRVRTITACQGALCSHGLINSGRVADRIAERFGARGGLPHKFKIGITGCPNGCIKPRENDLGIMGSSKEGTRYVLFVGGKMGKHPRMGDRLPTTIADADTLLDAVGTVIDWYAAVGKEGERFGDTLDRVGVAELISVLSNGGTIARPAGS